jgi:hypothetical protein
MIKWLYYLIYYLKVKLFIIYFYFYPRPKPYTLTDKYNDFFLLKKEKFTKSLENPKKYNQNITDLYYNIDELNKYVNNNTDFENLWKTRILLTNTPNGNIYIYYDVYKMGFVYYSDNIMNNDLLNSAAIEYVIKFSCLDLYVNEKDIINYNNKHLKSLLKYHFDINDEKKSDLLNNKDVFHKKKHNKDTTNKKDKKDEKKSEQQYYYTNKFIYAGKFRSINILNRKIIYPTNFKSNFLSGLSTNDNRLSYSAFKKISSLKPLKKDNII